MAQLQWQAIDSKYQAPVRPEQVNYQDTIGIGQIFQQPATSVAQQVLNRVPQEQTQPQVNQTEPNQVQLNVQNPSTPISVGLANSIAKSAIQLGGIAQARAGNPSDEMIQKAVQYGKQYNIDPAVFLAKAQIESKFDTNAGANKKMRYGGLFGLDTKAFGNKVYDMDFAFNEVAKQYINNQKLMQKHGIANPTFGDAYAYHQQGSAGANALRKGGNKLAGEVLNPYYKGYGKFKHLGIVDGFQPIFQNLKGNEQQRAQLAKNMTANQFYNYWSDTGNAVFNAWQNNARLVKFKG